MGYEKLEELVPLLNGRFEDDGIDLRASFGSFPGYLTISTQGRILFYERLASDEDRLRLKTFLVENTRRAQTGDPFVTEAEVSVIRRNSSEQRRATVQAEIAGMSVELFPKPMDEPQSVLDLDPEDAEAVRLRIVERLVLSGHSGHDLRRRVAEETGIPCSWSRIKADLANMARQIEMVENSEGDILRWAHRQRLLAAARLLWMRGEHREWVSVMKLVAEIDGIVATKRKPLGRGKDRDEYEQWSLSELEHFAVTGRIPASRASSRGKTVH